MADPATSISSAMDQFFAAMEAVANSPTSQPERQVLLSEAGTLANRFNYVDARLSELAENTNEQMSVFVMDINQHTKDIAQLNQQIARLERTPGGSPNDLLISAIAPSSPYPSWFVSTPVCKKTALSTSSHRRAIGW